MSKRSRACEFSQRERMLIYERDAGCLFCRIRYRMEKADSYQTSIFETMHYIPRSQGGLGIARNAAVGCKYHHTMLDNSEYTAEMREIFRQYLQSAYRDWNEDGLTYRKN